MAALPNTMLTLCVQNQIQTYEQDLRAESSQEIQALKAKLAAQEQKTAAADNSLNQERKKRHTAEASSKKWLSTYTHTQTKITEWEHCYKSMKEKHAVQQAEAQEWKTKYTGLKRKVTSWTEEEARPVKKASWFGGR
ncbi:hypothetical protein CC86DRAFT_403626 [Ophiobolus disseminans]|uniref:Uncharacterized protein n=1 Tax=Ophiobolus disseminans TaxID=1469910 RepID=A0A6A7A6R7_9PLEO|nr:hypothetical protein CC86DRAFT_403626 [Ophiobolus disseminans]